MNSRFCHVESLHVEDFGEEKRERNAHALYGKKIPLSPMAPVRCALLVSYLPLLFLPCQALSIMSMSATSPKHVLFDVNVSNNGARCRLILYKKGISENEVAIVSPQEVGGLNSEEYLTMNPEGKMPTLKVNESGESIPESDTICRYLLSKYADSGPSFQLENYKSNLIARLHDVYLCPIQGCMYKASPPFASFGTRKKAIAEFRRQMQIIDNLIEDDGMYLCGEDVSLADATLFPTMVFARYMLPKFDAKEPLPAKINEWFNSVIESDPDFKKVHDEIRGGIQAWEDRGRWDTIFLAGLRDEDPATIFDKIVAGQIPATVVMEDTDILAFKDINPAAPAHVLVIPKDRSGLSRLRKSSPEHIEILGRLLVAAGEISKDKSLGFGDGARIVINDGKEGGQEVFHLHVHVLGGRQLTWPPG